MVEGPRNLLAPCKTSLVPNSRDCKRLLVNFPLHPIFFLHEVMAHVQEWRPTSFILLCILYMAVTVRLLCSVVPPAFFMLTH